MFNTLKHRKPVVYVTMGIYLALISLIIFESCLPSGISGLRSGFIADIGAWFVNLIKGPQIPNSIAPLSFGEVFDSTVLGQDEQGNSNIAIGTTTLVTIPIQYPDKPNDYDVYNYEYSLNHLSENKDDYKTVLASRTGSNNIYYIDMRIVANERHEGVYQIDIKVADTLTYHYKFNIVPWARPTTFDAKINKTTLKIGETAKISTKLYNETRNDYYLRRYYDETLIPRNSSNEAVATIDEFGVVHALSNGTSTITYGDKSFDVIVTTESIIKPVTNQINYVVDENSNANPHLLDYDYLYDQEDNNLYSVLIYPSFSDISLEDQTFSYKVDDKLKALIAPYKYDEDGYPQFFDEDNKPCLRLSGYRKMGEVKLTIYSNNDNSIYKEATFNTVDSVPIGIDVANTTDGEELTINSQKVISATFTPKNVNNKDIHVEVDDNYFSVLNNDSTSVTITAKKIGTTSITVSSIVDPNIKKTYQLTIVAKDAINEDNYSDFHAFVRKFAGHFFLFLITGVFGFLFFHYYAEDEKKIWLYSSLSLACGVFTASLSELIQLAIPGRTGAFVDIGIDSLGYLLGTMICVSVVLIIRAAKNKKLNNKN